MYQKFITSETDNYLTDLDFGPDIIFTFISPQYPDKEFFLDNITKRFLDAIVFGCSTSGEIISSHVFDKSVALTAVHFKNTEVKLVEVDQESVSEDSFKAGQEISKKLAKEKLKHIMVLSDGLYINGAVLVRGLHDGLPPEVSITGGLGADGADFNSTFNLDILNDYSIFTYIIYTYENY